MKNLILLAFVVFSFDSRAQLFKPKIVGQTLSLKWNCPQQDYPGVNQLPESTEIKVGVTKSGNLALDPNIFSSSPFKKEFYQGINPEAILRLGKNKRKYKVDYKSCVDNFIATLKTSKNECKEGDGICQLKEDEILSQLNEQFQKSKYLKVEENVVILPKNLPGLSGDLNDEKADQIVKEFCSENKTSSDELLGQKVLKKIMNFPSFDCLKRYTEIQSENNKKMQEEYCKEDRDSPACLLILQQGTTSVAQLEQAFQDMEKKVLSKQKDYERIYGSVEDGKLVDKYFKNDFKFPAQNCYVSSSAMVENKYLNVASFDQQISDNLDQILDGAPLPCQKQFLQNYVASKSKQLEKEKEFNEFCEQNKTEYCKYVQNGLKLASSNIGRMMKSIYGDFGESVYKEDICEENAPTPLEKLLSKVKASEKNIRCNDLKPGEFKNITWSMNRDVAPGDYTLKKVADNKYEAYFNVNYYQSEGTNVTASEMATRAKQCMKDVSPFLNGPNGESLTIKLFTNDDELKELDAKEIPVQTKIGIATSGFRSNSRMYEQNIDCAVITHEVLHLFGLCDEYKESNLPSVGNYSCRAVASVPSIMSNQYTKFATAADKTLKCKCENSNCEKVLSGTDEEVKRFYMGRSFYEDTDYKLRTKFCSLDYLPAASYKALKEGRDKNILLLSDASSDTSLIVESREFTGSDLKTYARTKISCNCAEGDEECLSFVKSSKSLALDTNYRTKPNCPSGTSKVSNQFQKTDRPPYEYSESDQILSLNIKATEPSLLHPAHFERIIGGPCEDAAPTYIECSKFAYKSGDCNVPDYCRDTQKYLGIKQ